jgi:hypothetical protein
MFNTDRTQFDYPAKMNKDTNPSNSYGEKIVTKQDEFVCYSTLQGYLLETYILILVTLT